MALNQIETPLELQTVEADSTYNYEGGFFRKLASSVRARIAGTVAGAFMAFAPTGCLDSKVGAVGGSIGSPDAAADVISGADIDIDAGDSDPDIKISTDNGSTDSGADAKSDAELDADGGSDSGSDTIDGGSDIGPDAEPDACIGLCSPEDFTGTYGCEEGCIPVGAYCPPGGKGSYEPIDVCDEKTETGGEYVCENGCEPISIQCSDTYTEPKCDPDDFAGTLGCDEGCIPIGAYCPSQKSSYEPISVCVEQPQPGDKYVCENGCEPTAMHCGENSTECSPEDFTGTYGCDEGCIPVIAHCGMPEPGNGGYLEEKVNPCTDNLDTYVCENGCEPIHFHCN